MKWLALVLLLLVACVPSPHIVEQTQQAQRIYTVYLPIVMMPSPSYSAKRGVAMSYPQPQHCTDLQRVGAVWNYQWYPVPIICPDIESVPMISWEPYMEFAVGGNSEWLMGFNEPDYSAIIIPPQRAAELWVQIEAKYPDKKLVAPAPSQLNPEWITQFYKSYRAQFNCPPRLDALAMHCYFETARECINLLEWYKARAAEWDIGEVWLTEFAFWRDTPGCSLDDAAAEMDVLIDWLENDPTITRYAWYTNRLPSGDKCMTTLFDWSTGTITFWGQRYGYSK